MRYQPDSWAKRAAQALLLLLAIAYGARVVWSMLVPLLPALITLPALLGIYLYVFGRRR